MIKSFRYLMIAGMTLFASAAGKLHASGVDTILFDGDIITLDPHRSRVTRKDAVPFTFAELWERWGPDNLLTCTIITTDATNGIKALHTRMPVILPKDGFQPWLADTDPAVEPDIDAAVEIRPVSQKMNKPSYNEPDCIEPLVATA